MQAIIEKPRLLTPKEAAEFLGVTPGTLAVWRCVSRYAIPYVKIGGKVKYDETDLREWMESRKVYQAEARA